MLFRLYFLATSVAGCSSMCYKYSFHHHHHYFTTIGSNGLPMKLAF